MADYKRMVSYMYLYENGVKKKNVGYARVESRNGECKITLHMQLLGLLDSIFPTYLIQRQKEDTELVYLGDAFLKNQVMDSKLTANEQNIMGTGYSLSDMGGILLFLNEGVFFATEWDDKPVILSEVMEALKPKQKTDKPFPEPELSDIVKQADILKDQETAGKAEPDKKERKTEQIHTGEKEEAFDEAASKKALKEVNEGELFHDGRANEKKLKDDHPVNSEQNWIISDNVFLPENKELNQPDDKAGLSEDELQDKMWNYGSSNEAMDAEVPFYQLPRGWKTKEGFQKPQQERQPLNPWDIFGRYQETQAQQPQPPVSWEHKTEQQPEPFANQEFSYEMQPEPALNVEHKTEQQPEPHYEKNREKADRTEPSQKRILQEDYDIKDNPAAAKIFDSFPRIYPFEDNEIILCVKISPKDIGLLPADIWAFSNNSFLLHGYYCYNHMIFAKMKDRFGCRYILGVPGIFHNRERFMARMFGFECFKSIRKRELRQGDFGYWYIPISM